MDKQQISLILDSTIYKRARNYYKNGMVLDLQTHDNIVVSRVKGSGNKIYRVQIELDDDGDPDRLFCTCPCSFHCKHIGAVLFHLMDKPPLAHIQSMGLPEQLDRESIIPLDPGPTDLVNVPSVLCLPENRFEKVQPGTKRTVFLLEQQRGMRSRHNNWELVLKQQYIKKNGEAGALSSYNENRPSFVENEEVSILQNELLRYEGNRAPLDYFLSQLISWHKQIDLFIGIQDNPQPVTVKKMSGVTIEMVLSPHNPPDDPRLLPTLIAHSGKTSSTLLDIQGSLITSGKDFYLIDDEVGGLFYKKDLYNEALFLRNLFPGIRGFASKEAAAVLEYAKQYGPFITIEPLLEKIKIRQFSPQPVIYLEKRFNGLDVFLVFDYQGTVIGPAADGMYAIIDKQQQSLSLLQRDSKSEEYYLGIFAAILDQAEDTGFSWYKSGSGMRHMNYQLKDFLLECGAPLSEAGFSILLDKKTGAIFNTKTDIRIEVESGIDWLDLEVIEIDKEGKKKSVAIDLSLFKEGLIKVNGSYRLLQPEILEKLSILADVEKTDDGKFRISKFEPDLIDRLYNVVEEKDQSATALYDLSRRLLGLASIPEISQPVGLNGTLRPYQKAGLDWIHFLTANRFGACLADDMGLGKTVQAIAYIQHLFREEQGNPVLIVVPVSTLFNWAAEFDHFAPEICYSIHRGAGRAISIGELKQSMVILTSYHTMRNDIALFSEIDFSLVILDEAQAIKNATSKTFKAVKCLNTARRLSLTGTPVENSAMELWSQMHFLNPGLLGSKDGFRKEYLLPIERGDNDALVSLQKRVYPFILRRTKEEVAADLPEKEEITLYAEMGTAQRKIYDQVKKHYRGLLIAAQKDKKTRFQTLQLLLEGMLRLRQICLFPGLADRKWEKVESCKLERLKELLPEIVEEEHKVLLFSQFTEVLKRIREGLPFKPANFCYLDGATKDRKQEVFTFQNDQEKFLFLISLKAGGTGLNLTAAEYVFLFDPWWNPAVEAQAIDRAHRIGQKSKVFAYKLIVKDSIEEKILQLQQKKKILAKNLISEEQGFLKKLSEEEIITLFE